MDELFADSNESDYDDFGDYEEVDETQIESEIEDAGDDVIVEDLDEDGEISSSYAKDEL